MQLPTVTVSMTTLVLLVLNTELSATRSLGWTAVGVGVGIAFYVWAVVRARRTTGSDGDVATFRAEVTTTWTVLTIAALVGELRGQTPPAERWDPAAHGQSEYGRFTPPTSG